MRYKINNFIAILKLNISRYIYVIVLVLCIVLLSLYVILPIPEEDCKVVQVVLNISYSYIAAWIFYIVFELIPKRKEENDNLRSLTYLFSELFSNIHTLIAIEEYLCKTELNKNRQYDLMYKFDISNGKKCNVILSYAGNNEKCEISFEHLNHISHEILSGVDELLSIANHCSIDKKIIGNLILIKTSKYLSRFSNVTNDIEADKNVFNIVMAPLSMPIFKDLVNTLHSLTKNFTGVTITVSSFASEI